MIFILRSQQLQKKSNVVVVVAITGNYEIGHNLKSMQVRNPIFSRPMFLRVWNVMKLSFTFYNHGNYTKIKNGHNLAKHWCFETYTYSWGNLCQWYLQKTGDFFLVLDSRALLILLNIIYCSSVCILGQCCCICGYFIC